MYKKVRCASAALLYFGILLLIPINAATQPSVSKSKLPEGVSYIAIKDTTTGYPNDSIRFIVTGSLHERKPTILFVEGSGNTALVWYKDKESYISALPAHTYADYKDRYHLVVVSKPGVALCTPSNRPSPWDMDSAYISDVFWTCNMKDYYVSTTAAVLNYLNQQPYVDSSKLYLIGHSQGAHIVAKVAALYPQLVRKVAYMSASPFGRSSEDIISAYASVAKGELSHVQLQEHLDSIYDELKSEKQWTETITEKVKNRNYYITKSNSSFNINPSVGYLSKVQIPLLITYGTSDVKSLDCSFLPLVLLGTNVCYELKAYPGYDHIYFATDSNGNRKKGGWHWDEVFKDVVNWMEIEQ